MGWSGALTESSAIGSKITFTPNTTAEGAYTTGAFTAPKSGVYRFLLKGSGGKVGSTQTNWDYSVGASGLVEGGKGGATTGFLRLKKGETVFIGAGGTCSAAFVSKTYGASLSAISAADLLFVAGAGGGAGRAYKGADYRVATVGGDGGGVIGRDGAIEALGSTPTAGTGGTQTAGGTGGVQYSDDAPGNAGAYGAGGMLAYWEQEGIRTWSGRGGDGYFGGGSGSAIVMHNSLTDALSSYGYGGGGGSAYIKNATLTVSGTTYTSFTVQGGGAASNSVGSIEVMYYARAELPINFNGTLLERLFFNGTEVGSLVYNGVKLFIERIKRRVNAWYTSIRPETASRIPI